MCAHISQGVLYVPPKLRRPVSSFITKPAVRRRRRTFSGSRSGRGREPGPSFSIARAEPTSTATKNRSRPPRALNILRRWFTFYARAHTSGRKQNVRLIDIVIWPAPLSYLRLIAPSAGTGTAYQTQTIINEARDFIFTMTTSYVMQRRHELGYFICTRDEILFSLHECTINSAAKWTARERSAATGHKWSGCREHNLLISPRFQTLPPNTYGVVEYVRDQRRRPTDEVTLNNRNLVIESFGKAFTTSAFVKVSSEPILSMRSRWRGRDLAIDFFTRADRPEDGRVTAHLFDAAVVVTRRACPRRSRRVPIRHPSGDGL
ncbi:hypothetical protein EVAR_78271_1 [Eumeta japonica]|uniref:Uncharacterized protein n=1 Tax=Eumeta variegata TaxID=151549 RepID=A0A4C1T618_EUMVA|nr:hypothetical protein EVAR_78271_1 [Eumeta japonica]